MGNSTKLLKKRWCRLHTNASRISRELKTLSKGWRHSDPKPRPGRYRKGGNSICEYGYKSLKCLWTAANSVRKGLYVSLCGKWQRCPPSPRLPNVTLMGPTVIEEDKKGRGETVLTPKAGEEDRASSKDVIQSSLSILSFGSRTPMDTKIYAYTVFTYNLLPSYCINHL